MLNITFIFSCVFLSQFSLGVGQVFMSGDLRYLLLPYDTLVVILYLVLFFYYQDTNNFEFCSPNWKHGNGPLHFRSFHLKVGIGFLIGTQRQEGKTECYTLHEEHSLLTDPCEYIFRHALDRK